jgi:hypothetical protein
MATSEPYTSVQQLQRPQVFYAGGGSATGASYTPVEQLSRPLIFHADGGGALGAGPDCWSTPQGRGKNQAQKSSLGRGGQGSTSQQAPPVQRCQELEIYRLGERSSYSSAAVQVYPARRRQESEIYRRGERGPASSAAVKKRSESAAKYPLKTENGGRFPVELHVGATGFTSLDARFSSIAACQQLSHPRPSADESREVQWNTGPHMPQMPQTPSSAQVAQRWAATVAELRILSERADLMTDKDASGSGSQSVGQENEKTDGAVVKVEGPHRQTRSAHAAYRCWEWRRRQQSAEEERVPSRRMRAAMGQQGMRI